jgi:hypothetical protein
LLVLLGFVGGLAAAVRYYVSGLGTPVAMNATALAPAQPSGAVASTGTSTGLSRPHLFGPDTDLASAHSMIGFPWLEITLFLVLLAAAGAYVARVWVDSLRPLVTDSPPFHAALQRWKDVIFAVTQTPRGAKQYKNLLRFWAMRGRDPKTNRAGNDAIPDQHLVALGAIALADPSLLTEAQRQNMSVSMIVKQRLKDEKRADRSLLTALDEAIREHTKDDRGGVPAMERFISTYLELLP